MQSTFASGLRAGCVAAALVLAFAYAADDKSKLVGINREQVLARYGEPRSVMKAGGREILFFARERVILRDGVVVDVEPIATEPGAPRTSAAPAGSSAAIVLAPSAAAPAAAGTQPATAAAPAPATAAPATPATAGTETPTATATAIAPKEPQVSIKSVLPPGSTFPRPEPVNAEPRSSSVANTPAVEPPPETRPVDPPPAVAPARETPRVAERVAATAVTTTAAAAVPAAASPAPAPKSEAPTPPPALERTPPPAQSTVQERRPVETAATASPTAGAEKPAPVVKQRTATDELRLPDKAEKPSAARTYLIVVGGALLLAYVIWRIRQRQLELAATALTHNPFTTEPLSVGGTSARMSQEFLSKLDPPQFEQLVAAYYGKTGVVAERVTGDPARPVHIRISWKGEKRPFALVQCIVQPQGLVEVKPLENLLAALAVEDIRRGYVITTGKFSVPARDFAEEKHLTLMSGDVFLEKLNALPDSAREEVMQEIGRSEAPTPTNPVA